MNPYSVSCQHFSHHMLPSMTKGEIVENICLISVVIDVNISLLPLVSTVSYFIACLENWNVEDIEKINEDQCMWTIWLYRGLFEVSLVKF